MKDATILALVAGTTGVVGWSMGSGSFDAPMAILLVGFWLGLLAIGLDD